MFFSDFWIKIVKIMQPRVALALRVTSEHISVLLRASKTVFNPDFTGVIRKCAHCILHTTLHTAHYTAVHTAGVRRAVRSGPGPGLLRPAGAPLLNGSYRSFIFSIVKIKLNIGRTILSLLQAIAVSTGLDVVLHFIVNGFAAVSQRDHHVKSRLVQPAVTSV